MTFRNDVTDVLSDSVPHRIFVQGSADASGKDAPSLAQLIDGEAKQITFLPNLGEGSNRFSARSEIQIVPKDYANVHLPNLRASFVQERLQVFDITATILEGEVTRTENRLDRNATMVMFVGWPPEVTRSASTNSARK
jgi:hypothetical protein